MLKEGLGSLFYVLLYFTLKENVYIIRETDEIEKRRAKGWMNHY